MHVTLHRAYPPRAFLSRGIGAEVATDRHTWHGIRGTAVPDPGRAGVFPDGGVVLLAHRASLPGLEPLDAVLCPGGRRFVLGCAAQAFVLAHAFLGHDRRIAS